MRSVRLLVLVGALLMPGATPAQPPTLEYDVKAAFLVNFSRFVEWPPALRDQPFRMCTLRPDLFGTRLEQAAAGELWDGRSIEVHRLTSVRDARCHLLYVPEAATARFRAEQQELAGEPVLLVGESDDFLASGGMVRLFVEANRVRFSISQKACESAGLRVSSRLLRLAREVLLREEDPK